MIPHRWRRNAADNGFSDPNADVRPGRFANTVLGSIRGLMASGAASRDDAIGGLVAQLGASNVYAVSTNEVLIDIATGINGVPAAITAPFLLRLSFDTTLTGSAANVPHLKVDGFDCGPMLNRDAGALADGDLVKGRPVLALGEFATPTDTRVTRVRLLDATPSEIIAAAAATGIERPVNLRNSVLSNTQVRVTADRVRLTDAQGNPVIVKSLSAVIDTTLGNVAGGIDTGTFTAGTNLDFYAIYNPTTATAAALACLTGATPQLPAGYTFARYLGWGRLDANKAWFRILQVDDEWWYDIQTVASGLNPTAPPALAQGQVGFSGNTPTGYVRVPLTGLVPPNTRRVDLALASLVVGSNGYIVIAPNANYPLPAATYSAAGVLYATSQVNNQSALGIVNTESVPISDDLAIYLMQQSNCLTGVRGGRLRL